MKINRIYCLSLLMTISFGAIAQELVPNKQQLNHSTTKKSDNLATFNARKVRIKASPKWDKNTQAVYDLLVAQMKNARADYTGSVDTLIKFAKSQKDDRLFSKAFRTLLQTERYADAIDIVTIWQENTQLNISKSYVLALVLNNEIDKAYSQITSQLNKTSEGDKDDVLLGYLQMLMSQWYRPTVLKMTEKMYQDYPDNELVNNAYIKQLRWQGKTDKAVQVLDKYLLKNPRNLPVLKEKSDTYRYALRLVDAENVWKNLLNDYPNEPDFQFAYAQFLYDQYDFKGADKILQQINDVVIDYQVLKMMTKVQLGQFEAAAKSFDWKNLSQLEKDNIYLRYGNLLLQKKQYQRAQAIFEKVGTESDLKLRADLSIAEIKYVKSLAEGNAWFVVLQKKYQLDNTDIIRDKAAVMTRAGRKQKALELLNIFVLAHPKNENMRYSRALMAADMQQTTQAIEDLKMIYTTSPNNTEVQNALGYTLLGQPDQLAFASDIIKKSFFSQSSNVAVADSMGWLLYQQKKYQQALPFFRYAYSQYLDGEIIGHYIMGLFAAGQKTLAKKLYNLESRYQPNIEKMKHYVTAFTKRDKP
ncbi:MAG: hypothetical protein ACWIPH_06735 [Ostreibacterium sp.]